MDFRKLFCRLFGWIPFMYRFLNCIYYEPTPPEPPPPQWVEVKICMKCEALATPKCAVGQIAWRKYLKGTEPVQVCNPPICCKKSRGEDAI